MLHQRRRYGCCRRRLPQLHRPVLADGHDVRAVRADGTIVDDVSVSGIGGELVARRHVPDDEHSIGTCYEPLAVRAECAPAHGATMTGENESLLAAVAIPESHRSIATGGSDKAA